MASSESPCVFVGNIRYDATEQQLIEFLSAAGEVINFRIAYDRDTGKQKGYGFCEYKDFHQAQSAIRNLNGADFHGRSIRVDNAEADSLRKGQKVGKSRPKTSNKKTVDEITSIVEDLTQEEKVEILQQMKQLINDNEQGAKDLLMENPQLAQALLLIQMSFDLVKADDIRQLTEDANPTAATNLRPTPQVSASRPAVRQPIGGSMPQAHFPPQPQVTAQIAATLPKSQQEVLKKVLKLPEAEIAKLPPSLQAQVRQLRIQLANEQSSF